MPIGRPYLRIVPRNFHDEATLTVSAPEATGFEIINTQNCIRSDFYRSTDGSNVTIRGTFADNIPRTPSFFGMFLHQCHGGKIQLELFSDAAWSASVYDSGAVDVINVFPTDGMDWGVDFGDGTNDPFFESAPHWQWLAPTSPRPEVLSYEITLSDHVSTYGRTVWQASRFFLGPSFELFRQPEFGASLGFVDQTDRNRSRGGSLRTNFGQLWRVMEMSLGAMEESERAAWLDIFRYCGRGRDFVLSLFPEEGTRIERDHILNCKFATLNPIGREVRRLTTRLQIEEV